MKKYTLLAATALLSTVAMTANAGTTGANLTIHPQATMVSNLSLTSLTELNFGKVSRKQGDVLTITVSAGEGNALVTDVSGTAIYFGGAEAGKIDIAGPLGSAIIGNSDWSISFPSEIILSSTVGETVEECGRVTNFNQAIVAPTLSGTRKSVAYGGTYTVTSNSSTATTVLCTGEGVITVVATPAE